MNVNIGSNVITLPYFGNIFFSLLEHGEAVVSTLTLEQDEPWFESTGWPSVFA